MMESEGWRSRREQALATTDAGQKRLVAAAIGWPKTSGDADARPERGLGQSVRTSDWKVTFLLNL